MRCVFLDWEQITVSWKAFELCPQGSESNALTAYNIVSHKCARLQVNTHLN